MFCGRALVTTPVAAELNESCPEEFDAVSSTRIVWPTSEEVRV